MWLKLAMVMLAAVVGPRIYNHLSRMGYHKVLYNHRPGPCQVVEGVETGAEDIQILPNGLAFISSGLTFMSESNDPSEKNPQIRLLDLNNPEKGVENLKIEGHLDELNPHGLSLWQDPTDGSVRLFLINHLKAVDSVVIFHFDEKRRTLRVVKTIVADPAFAYTNDLVATGPEMFYFTNYLSSRSSLEHFLQLSWSSVGYFDGKKGRLVAEGLGVPNGINISPHGKFLYVSHTNRREILVYERLSDHTLRHVKSHNLYTMADNIDVDFETGDLWLGCIPQRHKSAEHAKNKSLLNPAQVLRLKMDDGNVIDITEVYLDDGRQISSSSVAARYKDKLLIGSVFTKMVLCELKCFD